jgi:SAM-dependent methyltransferase
MLQIGDLPAIACPICGNRATTPVLSRHNVPTLLNRSYDTAAAALSAPVGDLDIVACPACGFTFNRSFDESLAVYSTSYENDPSKSAAFSAHMLSMADRVLASFSPCDDIAVVEIGCGQGQFLRELVNRESGRISSAVGYDPAWRGGRCEAGVKIESRVFNRDAFGSQDSAPDAVILRHVIEHIPNPTQFFKEVRGALPDKWHGRLFIETPSLEWILRHRFVHDFVYEHCNYFTSDTLRFVLARAGFQALIIESVFEEQYHWVEATGSDPMMDPPSEINELPTLMRDLTREEISVRQRWTRRIARLSQAGKVAVWGAGAKGVSFVNAIDRSAQWISCVIDINPVKQNNFTPVTGHPIVSPRSAEQSAIDNIIIMNPNYRVEIENVLRKAAWRATLFDAYDHGGQS